MKKTNLGSILAGIGVAIIGGYFFLSRQTCCIEEDRFSLSNLEGKTNIVPVAIIGSGCAGYPAALYCARGAMPPVVFTGAEPGGALTKTTYVENWPGIQRILGSDLVNNLKEHAKLFGAQIMNDTVEKVDATCWPFKLTLQSGVHVNALSVIVASGSTPRKLGVEGEDSYWGRGVTTCAKCDAPFHKNKDVVIVGGGDSAVEEALQLSPYARSITILVRKGQMRAAPSVQDRLKPFKHITVQYHTYVAKIMGDAQGVTGVELVNDKTGQKTVKEVSGVFLAIGHEPNTKSVQGVVALTPIGTIALPSRTQATSVPGIFAAGDVADERYRQAGVASGDAIKAALDATSFLSEIGINQQTLAALKDQMFSVADVARKELTPITTLAEFKKIVSSPPSLVVVDCYAPYCPSCLAMIPAVENAAAQYGERATFLKVDITQAPELEQYFKITSVPCMLVYKDGNLVARNHNAMNRKELGQFLAQF